MLWKESNGLQGFIPMRYVPLSKGEAMTFVLLMSYEKAMKELMETETHIASLNRRIASEYQENSLTAKDSVPRSRADLEYWQGKKNALDWMLSNADKFEVV
jgi:hypothetical protein